MKLEYHDDGQGNLQITDRLFEDCQFADLTIAPVVGRTTLIRNVGFIDCAVAPGTCWVFGGVTLDGVVFSNLDCGDALRINSEVTLKSVVVKGRKPKALIVRPEGDQRGAPPSSTNGDYQLDVSDFAGDVEIIGLRGSMVRKDPERHVAIKASWKVDVNWTELGIGPFSYWRIFVKKLAVFNAAEGIFSLPTPSSKDYQVTMQEKNQLENAGLRFE